MRAPVRHALAEPVAARGHDRPVPDDLHPRRLRRGPPPAGDAPVARQQLHRGRLGPHEHRPRDRRRGRRLAPHRD
ncbi:hypothetical protein, partial [Actinomadura sp. CNU-125]|uniref:hypothetical protein n=1 Tax=Actinomadura sp. CNU-125 TaxID=1904961 RepID=UPI0021CC9772